MAKRRGAASARRTRAASPRAKARVTRAAARPKPGAAIRTLRRRQEPETLRLRAFSPGLTVNDLEASTRFYTDILGFIVGEKWSDAGRLVGVSLKAGACTLMLSQDDWQKGRDRKKGQGVRLWAETVQDIDALAARIKRAGGRLTEEPTDHPWGGRSLGVDDPDGFHLTISSVG